MKQLALTTLALFLLPVFFGGCGDEYSELEEVVESHDCFFCKEEVKGGAIKCKHCGEDPYNGDDKKRFTDTLFIKSIESARKGESESSDDSDAPRGNVTNGEAVAVVLFGLMLLAAMTFPFWGGPK